MDMFSVCCNFVSLIKLLYRPTSKIFVISSLNFRTVTCGCVNSWQPSFSTQMVQWALVDLLPNNRVARWLQECVSGNPCKCPQKRKLLWKNTLNRVCLCNCGCFPFFWLLNTLQKGSECIWDCKLVPFWGLKNCGHSIPMYRLFVIQIVHQSCVSGVYCKSGNFRATLFFALFAHSWASAKLKMRESVYFECRSM